MSLTVAFKAFFAALSNREASERIRLALSGEDLPKKLPSSAEKPAPTKPVPPKSAEPTRSDAITMLCALQREARLLDLVQESLDQFDDAQIGAAAREVLRDSRKTLDRMFGIAALAEEEEGQPIAIEGKNSPGKMRLIGKSEGSSGVVVHRGWKASRCEIPKWTGSRDEAWVLAPVEVEVN